MKRIKRIVVAVEVIAGAFILAAICGLVAQNLLGNEVVADDVRDPFVKTIVALVLIGGALFYDGLRRGRQWW